MPRFHLVIMIKLTPISCAIAAWGIRLPEITEEHL